MTREEAAHDRLEEENRRRGIPFRQTINKVIRNGLAGPRHRSREKRFAVQPNALRLREGLSYDNV